MFTQIGLSRSRRRLGIQQRPEGGLGYLQNYRTHESHSQDMTYIKMLKEEDQMSMKYNFFVGAANWSLLAGYLVIPGTFTSLQKSAKVEEALKENETGRSVLRTLQNPPLLAIACFFLIAGFTALAWLLHFEKLRRNYTWLIHKLFT